MAEDPRFIDDKAEDLRAASEMLNDEMGDMSERTKELLRQAVDSQRRHIAEGTRNSETQSGHIEMLADAYLDTLDALDKLFVESVKCDNIAKGSEPPDERYWAGRAHGIREAVLAITRCWCQRAHIESKPIPTVTRERF